MSSPSPETGRIAIVDDERRLGHVLGMVLRRDGHQVDAFTAPLEFLAAFGADPGRWDVVLTDLKMPGMDGVALLGKLRELRPHLPVVLVTAHGTVDTAVAAMKGGAVDYLQKPVDNTACRAVVRRALELGRLHRENRHLRAQLRQEHGPSEVIAEAPEMAAALDLARRAAAATSTVLITGESGTGKEVVARTIHVHSPRVAGPFVAINCKALASGVLESELFGHEKGAFTGAGAAREGLFERADGGTLFLDELGEIDGEFQAKLLRALQEGEITRVGGAHPRKVDVRVVAATNRDLQAEVAEGRFREDLYFRLAVIPVHLPPLRSRPADVLPLARFFLVKQCQEQGRQLEGWDSEVEAWMQAHDWPGNVRELQNTIERGVVLARGARITMADLLVGPAARDGSGRPGARETLAQTLDRVTAERVRQALEEAGGVRVEAAQALGVERTTLYRLMRKFEVEG